MRLRSMHSCRKDVVLQDPRDKWGALFFHPLPPVIGDDRQLHLTAGLRLQCRGGGGDRAGAGRGMRTADILADP